ncbi:transmembrane transport protein [Campylobacter fetus subsp. venerealis NCTC 10354]|nr:transmembrane transport protein [Campylobacter fetus subsp. venerealis NCTC 10354]
MQVSAPMKKNDVITPIIVLSAFILVRSTPAELTTKPFAIKMNDIPKNSALSDIITLLLLTTCKNSS